MSTPILLNILSRRLVLHGVHCRHRIHHILTSSTIMSSGPTEGQTASGTSVLSSISGGFRRAASVLRSFPSFFSSKFEGLTAREPWTLAERAKWVEMNPSEKRAQYHCKEKYVSYSHEQFPVLSDQAPKISVWKGDITTLEFDAIVNAANERMRGGGGVDGAIHRAAGSEMLRDSIASYPEGCKPGEAKITGGYRLPAKYVIHTVGPRNRSEEKLTQCYSSILRFLTDPECNIKTIAIPCISTGVFGYPNEAAANVALTTVKTWLNDNTWFNGRIVFCVFLENDLRIYTNLIADLGAKDEQPIAQTSAETEALDNTDELVHSSSPPSAENQSSSDHSQEPNSLNANTANVTTQNITDTDHQVVEEANKNGGSELISPLENKKDSEGANNEVTIPEEQNSGADSDNTTSEVKIPGEQNSGADSDNTTSEVKIPGQQNSRPDSDNTTSEVKIPGEQNSGADSDTITTDTEDLENVDASQQKSLHGQDNTAETVTGSETEVIPDVVGHIEGGTGDSRVQQQNVDEAANESVTAAKAANQSDGGKVLS